MASSNPTPPPISIPFAQNGERSNLPNNPVASGGDASMSGGFPPITSRPISEGGIPPKREDFNAMGYLATMPLYFLQNGGYYTFNPAVSTAIGGYPQGAILCKVDAAGVHFYQSAKNNNTSNFLTDATVIGTDWLDVTPGVNAASAHNIFEAFFSLSSETPPGAWPLTTGETITNCQTLYPDFWAEALRRQAAGTIMTYGAEEYEYLLTQNGHVGGFVIDTTAGSIRLPKINCILQPGEVGKFFPAGLPNITGTIYERGASFYGATGALGAARKSEEYGHQDSTSTAGITFDASLANAIFGASDTVQPPAIGGGFFIQVYNAATVLSEQESSQILAVANSKLNKDLSNLPAGYGFVIEEFRSADRLSWYRLWSSGFLEQGGFFDNGSAVTTEIQLNFILPFSKPEEVTLTLQRYVETQANSYSMNVVGKPYADHAIVRCGTATQYFYWEAKGKAAAIKNSLYRMTSTGNATKLLDFVDDENNILPIDPGATHLILGGKLYIYDSINGIFDVYDDNTGWTGCSNNWAIRGGNLYYVGGADAALVTSNQGDWQQVSGNYGRKGDLIYYLDPAENESVVPTQVSGQPPLGSKYLRAGENMGFLLDGDGALYYFSDTTAAQVGSVTGLTMVSAVPFRASSGMVYLYAVAENGYDYVMNVPETGNVGITRIGSTTGIIGVCGYRNDPSQMCGYAWRANGDVLKDGGNVIGSAPDVSEVVGASSTASPATATAFAVSLERREIYALANTTATAIGSISTMNRSDLVLDIAPYDDTSCLVLIKHFV